MDWIEAVLHEAVKDGPMEVGDEVAVLVDNGVVVVGIDLDENGKRALRVSAIAGEPPRVHVRLPVEE